ncbi:FAD dependent oxidoreductase [Legionella busanensis]|uniref:FAD dependent oxidoreductase n=1 Tax=Legionella busanensis TaxID=190655 RepID=A0A378JJJ8_9GAMM|nr:FAD-dependent monooxygenase [Legionella busanensis]STX50389.1 FAD dependent oxidoreductase [Legionella busanensis]
MAEQIIDALVVGAGPVGLFCANELSRHGVSCRIIDKKSTLSDKSKALAIHIRTLETFEDTSFLNDVLAEGHKVYGVLLKSDNGLLSEINFEKIGSNYNFLIDLPQNKTEDILYKGLCAKNIPLEWQTELISFQEGEPVIALVKKANGQTEEIATKWIIACDGAHSTLRHLCNAKFLGAEYKQQWWLADLYAQGDLPEDKIVIYTSLNGPLVCLPMGNKRYRLIMSMPANKQIQPTLEDIITLFNKRSSDEAKLYDPIWLADFSIHHRQIDHYRYSHVFFCGDAAHIHSPMGGQGLNTGIQDVYNLVWKLNLVLKGYARDTLLDSYQIERYPIAKAILKKTDLMTKMISLKSKPLINLRNKLMSKFTSYDFLMSPVVKDLAELNISYAKSPIVSAKGQKTRFHIGEFIPAITLKSLSQRTSKLLETICLGTLHNVFVFLQRKDFNEVEGKLMDLTQKYKLLLHIHLVLLDSLNISSQLPSIWLDENYIIQDRFNIKNSATMVVRPDKYIGYIESPFNLEHLKDWLESIFNINSDEAI